MLYVCRTLDQSRALISVVIVEFSSGSPFVNSFEGTMILVLVLSWELGCAQGPLTHTPHSAPGKKLALPSPSAELSTCFTAPSPTAFFSWDKEQQDRKKAAIAQANCLSNLGKASFKT